MGGTGSLVQAGWSALIGGQGGIRSLQPRRSPRSRWRPPAQAVERPACGWSTAKTAARRWRPTSWCRTPIRPGPTAIWCPPEHRHRWTDSRIERARYSMSLFVWYFGTRRQVPGSGSPHHRARSAVPRTADRHLRAEKLLAEDFSLYLHRPTATDPSLAPARMRCVLCAVAGAAPAKRHRLGCARRAVPLGHAQQRLQTPCCRVCRTPSSRSRLLTPQDFQDRLSSFRGAAFSLEPVLTQSAWFRPHNRSEELRQPVPRRCRHPPRCRPARRAVVGARPRLGGAPRRHRALVSHADAQARCRCPYRIADAVRIAAGLASPAASAAIRADLAACRAALRDGSRTFWRRRCCCRAAVRDPACALYAFCRLADDAVDGHERRAEAAVAQLLRTRAAAVDRIYARRSPCVPRPAAGTTARSLAVVARSTPSRARCSTRCLEGFEWDLAGPALRHPRRNCTTTPRAWPEPWAR